MSLLCQRGMSSCRGSPGTSFEGLDEARMVPLDEDGELNKTIVFQRQMRDERYPDCPWVFFQNGKRIRGDFRVPREAAAKKAEDRGST